MIACEHRVQVIDFSEQVAGTGMKCPSVFRQLHTARCPVQEPGTDIFFQLPDRRRGPALLDAQAIGCAGEAPHFRHCYEYEDGFEIMHFHATGIVLHMENS